MDVSQTPATTSSSAASATSGDAAPGMVSSDFETFLKMLTAQLKNQDPLNPVESTDYAVQLATFSSVEQQVRTNQLLEQMAGQYGAMGMSQLAGWVGMEARSTSPALFSGTPISVVPNVMSGADQAEIVVRNAQGAEVQRFAIATNSDPITWAGVLPNGTPLADGVYRFDTVSYVDGHPSGTNPAETYTRIAEARVSGARTLLVLDSGVEVDASEIKALRGG